MSGAEALAVLPLVISGLENFRKVAQPFRRYKHFPTEAQTFRTDFRFQRELFRSQIEFLLRSAVHDETACEMMMDAEYSKWTSSDLDSDLQQALGSRYQAFSNAMELIETELAPLEKIDCQLAAILDAEPRPTTEDRKQWRERIAPRVKLCLSQTLLSQRMDSLKSRLGQLQTFIDLNDRLKTARQQELRRPGRTPLSRSERARFTLIHSDSAVLYQSIGLSCTKHTEHLVSIGLSPEASQGSRVRFELAIRQPPASYSLPESDPMWLAIESAGTSEEHDTGVRSNKRSSVLLDTLGAICEEATTSNSGTEKFSKLQSCFRRSADTLDKPLVKRQKPSVQFLCAVEVPPQEPIPLPDLVNHCSPGHQNLCMTLMNCMKKRVDVDECIGFLQNVSGHKHLVYVKTQSDQYLRRRPKTLASFLSAVIGPSGMREMNCLDRIRFSRMLATAVLQFHSTPWLKHGWWRSNDICFNDTADSMGPIQPFIELPISKSDEVQPQLLTKIWPFRNPLMFGLAIILIELAFQRPFRSMMLPDDEADSQNPVYIEWHAAVRLSATVGVHTVPRFKKVVERCLYCTFASEASPDFAEPKLQELFYSDVICELLEIEKAWE